MRSVYRQNVPFSWRAARLYLESKRRVARVETSIAVYVIVQAMNDLCAAPVNKGTKKYRKFHRRRELLREDARKFFVDGRSDSWAIVATVSPATIRRMARVYEAMMIREPLIELPLTGP